MSEPTKAMMDALGKMFAAEVNSAFQPNLPPIAQIGAAVGRRLVAEGLAEEVEATLSGHPPVTVRGHVLTLKGHMLYCMAAQDEEDLSIEKATGDAE